MKPIVGVKIENRHLAELVTLRGSARGLLKLTTLKPDQRKAAVRVYLLRRHRKDFLTEFVLQDVHRKGGKTPAIDLEGFYNGKFRLDLTLKLNGVARESRSISLVSFLPGRFFLRRILPPLAVVLLAVLFLLLGLPRLRESRRGDAPPRTAPETPMPADTPRDTPPPADTPPEEPPPTETPPKDPPPADTPPDIPPADTPTPADTPPEAPPVADTPLEASPPRDPAPKEEPQPEAAAATESSVPFDGVTIYFGPDSSELTPEAREQLSRIAGHLSDYRGPVSISGHCASYGTESGRMDLSHRRAEAVYTYLRRQGWEPEEPPRVDGYGSTMPAVDEEDRQHLNRRVEILPKR